MIRLVVKTMAFVSVAVFVANCWAGEKLSADPRVLTGKLENGVTWMYRRHATPPGRMAMLVHVRTGSLNETEAQRGLAYFVERMGFRGTENFGPGELVPYFESIGMEFGADRNARATFDETAYMLFLPGAAPEQIERGLTVLSDFAFRGLLLDEEIDKERGVILEELRAGQSAGQRMRDKLYPRLFAGSRFAERMPIGLEAVISGAPRAEFEKYYRTWYRPENVTLLMVGDSEFEPLRPLVEKWFGQYRTDVPAQSPKGPEFKPFTEQRALIVTDPGYSQGEVTLLRLRLGRRAATTVEEWRVELIEYLACRMVERRLVERVQKEKASYESARLGVRDFFYDAMLASGSVVGKPQDWEKMLGELVVEVNRACQFGFNQRELDLVTDEVVAALEHAVESDSKLNAQHVLLGMAERWNDGEAILSPQQEFDMLNRLLPTVKLPELKTVFAEHFAPGTFAYILKMPAKEGIELPSEEAVLVAVRAALAGKVEAPAEKKGPADLLTVEPKPGKVVESTIDEDLAITSAWLENGVRVHHRYMDHRKDAVFVSISLAGGRIEETAENAGVTRVATLVFDQARGLAATSRLSSADIADIMTGERIRITGGPGDDALIMQISGSPKDLETGLKLAHVLLTDAKLEEAPFNTWLQASVHQLTMAQNMPQFSTVKAMRELASGGDHRRTLPTVELIKRQTVAAAQAWLKRICRSAPIEVAIVGDVSLADAMPLIEKYIGSLPPRPRVAEHLDALRTLNRQPGPLEKRISVETMVPQGAVSYCFIGCDAVDVDDARLLQMAADVLDKRVMKRLREERGLVHTIQVRNEPSLAYVDSGMFVTGGPCDPAKVDEVLEEIESVFKAFAESGPTAEELDDVRKRVADELDKAIKEPVYWWRTLQNHDLHKVSLAKLKTIKEDFAAFTSEQVRDVFRKYYTPERTIRVIVTPATAPATSQPATPPQPASAPAP